MSDQYASIRPLFVNSGTLWDSIIAKHPAYIMDIGAHHGGFSSAIAGNCGRIDAFEPVPDKYEIAKKLEKVYPNLFVFMIGMSDKAFLERNVNVFNCCTLLPNDVDLIKLGFPGCGRAIEYAHKPPFNMLMSTIDDWVALSRNGNAPDAIKIDVDGYEVRVLKGALKTLTHKPCPIHFEYSYLPGLLGDTKEEMADIIYGLGYRAWSGDGAYVAPDVKAFLACYPKDTSYDLMLIHSSQR